MAMASSYPFKEGVLNEIVEALLDLKHCRASGGSGGAATPPHSLSLPPLPANARRKRWTTKIILERAKRWHFASMPAIEVADHRSTKKIPPIRVSTPAIGRKMAPNNVELSQAVHRSTKINLPIRVPGPRMKKAAENMTPLKNVEPSCFRVVPYELHKAAHLNLLVRIPPSNTKMATFGKEDHTKGKQKIADAGLEGDYICNSKKAKLSAKFEADVKPIFCT